jgi:alkylhydroperoxidase family enzyme
MSRIPLVERDPSDEEVAPLFDQMEGIGFAPLNVFRLWANNTKAAAGMLGIAEALYGSPVLSPRLRELAYLRASQLNSCHY